MSLPQNVASSAPMPSALLLPDTSVRNSKLEDYEMGGVAINDPSLGLQVRQWRVFVQGAQVCVAPHPEGAPVTALFPSDDVTELSLAFDQLMHATVAFVQAGVAKLYWYDTAVAGQVITPLPGAKSPMLCLDDKRALQVAAGVVDVLFFYLLDGSLCYRQQRDRFTVERVLAALPPGSSEITGVGMGTNGRVQVHLNAAVASHVDLADDKLYLLNELGELRAVHDGAISTATWRSGIFETHDQPCFGWARVDALAYPVALTLRSGTVVVATVSVTSDEPVRLPAIRAREWSVEVSGSGRVRSVLLASSREELEAGDAADL